MMLLPLLLPVRMGYLKYGRRDISYVAVGNVDMVGKIWTMMRYDLKCVRRSRDKIMRWCDNCIKVMKANARKNTSSVVAPAAASKTYFDIAHIYDNTVIGKAHDDGGGKNPFIHHHAAYNLQAKHVQFCLSRHIYIYIVSVHTVGAAFGC
jgi:hypothetical protein